MKAIASQNHAQILCLWIISHMAVNNTIYFFILKKKTKNEHCFTICVLKNKTIILYMCVVMLWADVWYVSLMKNQNTRNKKN